jgi:phosphoribosylformimino-5-aminoimidazole carboxamide ribotide isomerase
MGKFIVYPAIDLRFGKVVRLKQGREDQQKVYSNDPKAVAQELIDQGAEWLHVINLNGAFGEDTQANESAIKDIVGIGKDRIKIQLGGGLRKREQIKKALSLGISRVIIGTAVMENPAYGIELLDSFGGKKIVFGLDALNQELMSRGWKTHAGIDPEQLAQDLAHSGAETLIFTNISKDGMQTGVDWEYAKQLADLTRTQVIASGGVSTIEHLIQVCKAGLAGVVVGRALYEGNFSLQEALDVC